MTEEVKILEDEKKCETCQIRENGKAIEAKTKDPYATVRYRTPFCVPCAFNPQAATGHKIIGMFGLDAKKLGLEKDNWVPITQRAEEINVEELTKQ